MQEEDILLSSSSQSESPEYFEAPQQEPTLISDSIEFLPIAKKESKLIKSNTVIRPILKVKRSSSYIEIRCSFVHGIKRQLVQNHKKGPPIERKLTNDYGLFMKDDQSQSSTNRSNQSRRLASLSPISDRSEQHKIPKISGIRLIWEDSADLF